MTADGVALVVGLLINAIAVVYAAFWASRTTKKLEQLSKQTNGRMSELLDEVRSSSMQKGIEIGNAEQKGRS
jgi:FtsZ-interacting cell division protein ZipA